MPLADNLWLNSWQYIAGFTFTAEELRHRANPLGILFELGACLVGALSNAGNRLTRTDDLGRDFYRLIGQHKITLYYRYRIDRNRIREGIPIGCCGTLLKYRVNSGR